MRIVLLTVATLLLVDVSAAQQSFPPSAIQEEMERHRQSMEREVLERAREEKEREEAEKLNVRTIDNRAGLIPSTMRGKWCGFPDNDAVLHQALDNNECVDEETTYVDPHGYAVEGVYCRAIRVRTFDQYPWGRRASKNPWGPGAVIKFRCKMDEAPRKTAFTTTVRWRTEKDYLYVEELRGSR
jgi:hypothetical protein